MCIKPLCIFGAGGLAQETIALARSVGYDKYFPLNIEACLDKIWSGGNIDGVPIKNESYFDPQKHSAIIAIADPKIRKSIVERIEGPDTEFITLIHPTAIISPRVIIGGGCLICAFCFISNGTTIGNHVQLNWATTIGHEAKVGGFTTTAPGVHISGTDRVGDGVYIGTNAAIINGISVVSDTIIGAGACVVKDILEPGTYVGVPAKKIK